MIADTKVVFAPKLVSTPGTEVAPGSDEIGVDFKDYGGVRVGAAFNGTTIGD